MVPCLHQFLSLIHLFIRTLKHRLRTLIQRRIETRISGSNSDLPLCQVYVHLFFKCGKQFVKVRVIVTLKDGNKLVAADPIDRTVLEPGADDPASLFDIPIASLMSLTVIDLLEVVQVKQRQRKFRHGMIINTMIQLFLCLYISMLAFHAGQIIPKGFKALLLKSVKCNFRRSRIEEKVSVSTPTSSLLLQSNLLPLRVAAARDLRDAAAFSTQHATLRQGYAVQRVDGITGNHVYGLLNTVQILIQRILPVFTDQVQGLSGHLVAFRLDENKYRWRQKTVY